MVAASQTHRELEFISPLGKDVLLLHKFEATEELGRPYNFELTLRSTSKVIDFEALLGKNVSVRLDVAGSMVKSTIIQVSTLPKMKVGTMQK